MAIYALSAKYSITHRRKKCNSFFLFLQFSLHRFGTVVVARLPGRCGQHGGQRQDRLEGVSDEGGVAGAAAGWAAAGAEVLAASSEPSHGDPRRRQRRALGPGAGGWVRALGWTGNGDR